MNREKKKKAYSKPRLVHREKVEVLAAVCDSSWVPGKTCMIEGQAVCKKTRF